MANSSDEEDDYMSDAFLTKTIESDIRPGLVKSHKIARQNEMDAKRARINTDTKQLAKPMKQLEAERREEGLNTAISSNNKGFEMLTKMGYKPGESLGRSSSGIVEPITIQLKTDRGGLGRAAAIKQLEEYKEKLRQARAEKKTEDTTNSICQFRQRMAEKTGGKLLESDLCKCQRACEKLDLDASIEAPAMLWFWPIRKTNDPSETSEDPYDQTNEEQPKRKRAVSSSDEDSSDDVTEPKGRFGDFSDTDDSSQSAQIDGVIEEFETIDTTNDNRNATDVENESEIEYEVTEKLEMLTNYLRTTYCYCQWCGIHYKDADDMNDNCPGLSKDEH